MCTWSTSKVTLKGFCKAQRWLRSNSSSPPFSKRQKSPLLHTRIISDLSLNSAFLSVRREAAVSDVCKVSTKRHWCRPFQSWHGENWQNRPRDTASVKELSSRYADMNTGLAENANTAKSAALPLWDFGLTKNNVKLKCPRPRVSVCHRARETDLSTFSLCSLRAVIEGVAARMNSQTNQEASKGASWQVNKTMWQQIFYYMEANLTAKQIPSSTFWELGNHNISPGVWKACGHMEMGFLFKSHSPQKSPREQLGVEMLRLIQIWINWSLNFPFHHCPSLPVCLPLWCPVSLGRSCLFPFEDGFLDDGHSDPSLTPGLNSPTRCQNGERMERYSRKVFVGGLPPDIDEGEFPVCCSFALMLMHTPRCISDWMSPRTHCVFGCLPLAASRKYFLPCLDVHSGLLM